MVNYEHALPDTRMSGSILDVGCGNGEALSHFTRSKYRVGIDIDSQALACGRMQFPGINLVEAPAEKIPESLGRFDVVMSRVALPYTEIRLSLGQIYSALEMGGEIFITMHDWRHQLLFLNEAVKLGAIKRVIDHIYIAYASIVFAMTGKSPDRPWWRGFRETFQTQSSMRRELKRVGFSRIVFTRTNQNWIINARKM
jgi:ubiquinone/menaquinone biosynthesis C-methylase UbiE